MIKVLKAVYDSNTKFILDIVDKFEKDIIIETFSTDNYKELKTIRGIQTRFGTKNLPLIVFEDENLEEVAAIWPEAKPDWEEEIKLKLNK